MKLKKIIDTDQLQVFKILSPSKKFKEMFPKKYIYSIDMGGQLLVMNTNEVYRHVIGYVFTYSNTFPTPGNIVSYQSIGSTFSRCLDTYFAGKEPDKVNVILACSPKNLQVPCKFLNEIIIRTNTDKIMEDPKKIITNIVNKHLSDIRDITVEQFVNNVVYKYPTNNNGLPVRYPKNISNKNVNDSLILSNDIFVEYDLRAKSYDAENTFITTLENSFEDMAQKVYIRDNYNNILDRVQKALDKNNLTYKILGDTITTSLINIRKIEKAGDITYTLTDFI